MTQYIHGMHVGAYSDHAAHPWTSTGAALMSDRPGVLVFTEIVGDGHDYRQWSDAGYTVLVRLNYSYGAGTIPPISQYDQFAQRCAVMVAGSRGVDGWIIGNEPNASFEWPDGVPITAEDYANCFELCRAAIRVTVPDAKVLVAGIAPYNDSSGDWVAYLADVLSQVGCDGVVLHAYTHAHDPALITSEQKMNPPYQNRHYEFRTYRDFMTVIPADMPVWIAESNPGADPDHKEWRDVNNGWVRAECAEIDQWNKENPRQQIRGVCLYRYPQIDQWWIVGKAAVEADFVGAVNEGYKWTDDPEPPEEDSMQNPSLELPYEHLPGRDTIKVAHEWTAFWSEGLPPEEHSQGPCVPPEYKPLPRSLDPRRVVDGDTAQCWFLTNKVMDAGIYQVVPTTPGRRYTFDISLQAWCSNGNDPSVSDEEMYGTLGVSTTGNTAPWSIGVQWSEWLPLDHIHRRLESREVIAEGSEITLFVRTWNKWRMRHNDVYADDAHLIEVGEAPPGPDPEPPDPGTPTECHAPTLDQIEQMTRRVVREEIDKTKLGT